MTDDRHFLSHIFFHIFQHEGYPQKRAEERGGSQSQSEARMTNNDLDIDQPTCLIAKT